MTTIFHILVPVIALLGAVAFVGGGVLLPLFELVEESTSRAGRRFAGAPRRPPGARSAGRKQRDSVEGVR